MKPHIQGASVWQQLIGRQKFLNSFQEIKATLCRNWQCVGLSPRVQECNDTDVNPNPRSVTICQT